MCLVNTFLATCAQKLQKTDRKNALSPILRLIICRTACKSHFVDDRKRICLHVNQGVLHLGRSLHCERLKLRCFCVSAETRTT